MTFQFPEVSFGMFTVREFAAISEMSEDLVRLWRSRGHIREGGGRGASYPANALAEATIRHDLSRYGIPPSDSAQIGSECAGKILRYVMINHADACRVVGPRNAVDHLRSLHQNSDALVRMFYGADVGDEVLARIDGGELQYIPFEGRDLHSYDYRSALVFNLQGYAKRIVELADKPILTFRFDGREGEEEVESTLADN
jgi:hypothetical protein